MSRLLFYCRVKNNYIQSAVHYASEEIHTPKVYVLSIFKKNRRIEKYLFHENMPRIKVLFNKQTLNWAIYDEKNWYTEVYLFVTIGSDDKSLISRRRWDLDQAGATMKKKENQSSLELCTLFSSALCWCFTIVLSSRTQTFRIQSEIVTESSGRILPKHNIVFPSQSWIQQNRRLWALFY